MIGDQRNSGKQLPFLLYPAGEHFFKTFKVSVGEGEVRQTLVRKCTLVQLFCKDFGRYVWGSLTIINNLRNLLFPITGCFVEIGHKMFICGNIMVLIIIAKYYKQLKCSRTGKWLIKYGGIWNIVGHLKLYFWVTF